MIEEKQMTVLFHIDDLMLAHLMPHIVTELIRLLDGVYGSQDPLTVTRGKIHEYLGITIDFSLKRGVVMCQYDFVKKFWNILPRRQRKSLIMIIGM